MTYQPNGLLGSAVQSYDWTIRHLGVGFVLRCFQRLSLPRNSYPALHLVVKLVHQRRVHSGPLVLGTTSLTYLRLQQIETNLSHAILNYY